MSTDGNDIDFDSSCYYNYKFTTAITNMIPRLTFLFFQAINPQAAEYSRADSEGRKEGHWDQQ